MKTSDGREKLMEAKEIKKPEKKEDILKNDLEKISKKLEKAEIKQKEIEDIIPKIRKLMRAKVPKEILLKVIHLLIMQTTFRLKFLKSSFRRIPQLLAEFGIEVKVQVQQLAHQAESVETFGAQYPFIAVDPSGKWIAQAAATSTHGKYRIEFYQLKEDEVFYHHALEFSVKGDLFTISTDNQIKGMVFNTDGNILWASVGSKPDTGPFKTYLVKINPNEGVIQSFGPMYAYEYYNSKYSRIHLEKMKIINDNGVEKIISPMILYPRSLVLVECANPANIEVWELHFTLPNFPNFFIRCTDIGTIGNWIYVVGWAENARSSEIPNPVVCVMVLDLSNRSLIYGPYLISEMLGFYDYHTNTSWPLKIRTTLDGTGVYVIAQQLSPTQRGGPTPDHSGFSYIELESGKIWLRDTFPWGSQLIKFQMTIDIIESQNKVYLQLTKRDQAYNYWRGLVRLNDALYPSDQTQTIPDDWWHNFFAELHPKRPKDIIISSVRPVFHPVQPTGLVSIWEAF